MNPSSITDRRSFQSRLGVWPTIRPNIESALRPASHTKVPPDTHLLLLCYSHPRHRHRHRRWSLVLGYYHHNTITMRLIAALSTISALVAPTYGYSLNKKGLFGPDLKILSQKESFRNNDAFSMSVTRRETIKMPSQTPMVPWKVRRATQTVIRLLFYRPLNLLYRLLGAEFGLCAICGHQLRHVPRPHPHDQQIH